MDEKDNLLKVRKKLERPLHRKCLGGKKKGHFVLTREKNENR